MSLTGPDGLLKQLTKTVIETALDEEMAPSTWAMGSMTRPVRVAAISATGRGPRRC